LPRHVRSLDVGGFARDGSLVSVGDVEEFFILNEFARGDGYNRDLERLRDGGELQTRDLERADALCDYLVGIHQVRGPDPTLYVRRLRELVGHHECIMGILDAYPPGFDGFTAETLKAIEHACIDWRWRLKASASRLRQVHGDFHPWNILFEAGTTFTVLDRSRGEWGDPADDITALTINYLFFSLQRSGRLDSGFDILFSRFWKRYLDATGDHELQAVVGPFFAFRGLVVANPLWYPRLAPAIRTRLLNFVRAVLDTPRFEPARVNEYCEHSSR
jgi:aminoglycoside phosphotransferase (APT) family kinase protein